VVNQQFLGLNIGVFMLGSISQT